MTDYDLIIIGAGPGGMTAGIYAARRAMKTLILTMDIGGQMSKTQHIENYPGTGPIDGNDLSQKMYEQAVSFGCEVQLNKQVTAVEKAGEGFLVKVGDEEFSGKKVLLSFGKAPKRLDVPGDVEFSGRGVTYCATCDGPLYKNKVVAVIGGGNSALDAALYLQNIASKVYIVHRRDRFRGEEIMGQKVIDSEKIEKVWNSVVTEVVGSDVVEKIIVKDTKTGEEKDIAVDGVFVEIGFEVKADFVKDLVKFDEAGQIVVDEEMRTSERGIFAAGDITPNQFKQIAVAVGHGSTAALAAYNEIQKESGQVASGVDWGPVSK